MRQSQKDRASETEPVRQRQRDRDRDRDRQTDKDRETDTQIDRTDNFFSGYWKKGVQRKTGVKRKKKLRL